MSAAGAPGAADAAEAEVAGESGADLEASPPWPGIASDCGAARSALSGLTGASHTADSHAVRRDLERDSSAAQAPGPAQGVGAPQVASSGTGLQQGVLATASAAAMEPAAADAGGAHSQGGSYSLAQPQDMLHARDLVLHSLQSPRSLSRSAVTARCSHVSL